MQMIQRSTEQKIHTQKNPKQGLSYTTVWRWHFYAGLFCIPFILWLSLTGLIYLFKPQIDEWIDRPYNNLVIHQAKSPSVQVNAALKVVPNSIFSAVELGPNEHSATRVLVAKNAEVYKVYIHPESLEILKIINQDDQFTRQVFHLHGELMLGDNGSRVVEIAASWTIIMIVTGIYLWLGKGGKLSFGGMVYPRLNRKGRAFWKDIHAVTGFWVAFFTIFLLISGLPWTASWGGMLKNIRQWSAPTVVQQDWTTSSKEESHHQKQKFDQAVKHMQFEHHHMMVSQTTRLNVEQAHILDDLISKVDTFKLQPPIQIQPSGAMAGTWSISSQTQNRPLRETFIFDEHGNVIKHETFANKLLLDRLIGYGVAIHEGQMFGLLNLMIGVFTVIALILVSISGLIMWIKRKPQHELGAPPISLPYRLSLSLKVLIMIIGIILPLLGLTLIVVLLLEKFCLSKISRVAQYLGLTRVSTG